MGDAAVPPWADCAALKTKTRARLPTTHSAVSPHSDDAETVIRANVKSDDKLLSTQPLGVGPRLSRRQSSFVATHRAVDRTAERGGSIRAYAAPELWPSCRPRRRSRFPIGRRRFEMRRDDHTLRFGCLAQLARRECTIDRRFALRKAADLCVPVLGDRPGRSAGHASSDGADTDKDDRVSHEAVLRWLVWPGPKARFRPVKELHR